MNLQQLIDKAEVKASKLNPYLHDKAIELVKLAYDNGYEIIITQGYRSISEQNELYAQGRTKPGNIVTNSRGGYSNHNYGLAFDIAVLNKDGSIDWNTISKYKTIGKLGKNIGLSWGGDWVNFVDYPHFEFTYGLTINQLLKGAKIPDYPAGYKKEEEYMIKKEDAEQIIAILSDYWFRMEGNKAVQDYTHYLANEVRKASGIIKQ